MKTLTPLLLMIWAGSTAAQSVNSMAQMAINADGKDCPTVTVVKAIGTTEEGTPLAAAACSNGSRHVLKIRDDRFEYLSPCWMLEGAQPGFKCFK